MIRARRATILTAMGLGFAGTIVGGGVASASYGTNVNYGYIQSNSICHSAGYSNCSVYLSYNSVVTETLPQGIGEVTNCIAWGLPDGTSIYSAITSHKLNNHYVAVIWGGGGQGHITCHG